MSWCKRQNFKILAYLLVLSSVCLPADAYILKGEHVLQLMMEKNNPPVRMLVHQTVSFLDSGIDTVNIDSSDAVSQDYEQRVRYRIPEEFRADIQENSLYRIHAVSSDQSLTVIDGQVVSESESWVDHYKDIFLYRSRKRLADKLESLGIDFSVTSLGRYQGTICYILGAQYPDESVPQLWIAKDSFWPMRWIYDVAVIEDRFEQKEILYSDWENYHQVWYPSKIEFLENRKLIQRVSVHKVEINPQFSGDLFDIEKLKENYSHEPPALILPGDQDDINKRIEEFKKIYE